MRMTVLLALLMPAFVFAKDYPDQGTAYAGCISDAASSTADVNRHATGEYRCTLNSSSNGYFCAYEVDVYKNGSLGWIGCMHMGFDDNHFFPAGSTCATRLPGAAGMINGQLTSTGVCDTGCKMVPILDSSYQQTMKGADSKTLILYQGTWQATGDVCSNDLPSPPQSGDNCVSMGGNAKLCKTDNDETCISPNSAVTSAGTYCYKPGEYGPKVGPDRRDGASLSLPNTPPNAPSNREGENFVKTGEASITNNITNTTYNSASYGNSGSANTGTATPGDGSGSSGSGEGESEGSGSASGGGDCATPYVCSGDAVLCSVGQQVYLQRCGTSNGDADGDGQPDWTKVDGSDPGDIEGDSGELKAAHRGSVALGLSRLDDSGFLSGYRCPTFGTISTSWGSFKLDENGDFCNILKVARGALMLLGAFIALTILMGKGE